MSDGITDSYRDQKRAERYGDFLRVLVNFIENQVPENLALLTRAAEAVDGVPRGLMSGETNIAEGLNSLVAGLVSNDPKIWGNLLLTAMGSYSDRGAYKKLKKLSPFAGRVLIGVGYGQNFVSLDVEELQEFLDHLIQGRENLKIYDADKYLVALPESLLADSKVTWLQCGHYKIKEPRKAREK